MKYNLAGFFPTQQIAEGAGEGLPYWIFWLLLCAILLLLTFIFLRDKDLRQRLDTFFAGFKKKLVRLRLQSQLKKENDKFENTLTGLGKKAWEENLRPKAGESLLMELAQLETQCSELKEEKNATAVKITQLQTDLDSTQKKFNKMISSHDSEKEPFQRRLSQIKEKEREIEAHVLENQNRRETEVKQLNQLKMGGENPDQVSTLSTDINKINKKVEELVKQKHELEQEADTQNEKIQEIKQKIQQIQHELRQHERRFHKEIKEWEKSRDRLQDKIRNVDKQINPLFTNLGRLINEERPEHPEMGIFYSQLDRMNQRIHELETQIIQLEHKSNS
jgi:DNA repair exonuclease SbcCD ATPase subunit